MTPPKELWVFMHPTKDISKMEAFETLAYPYEPTHSALKYLAERYINVKHMEGEAMNTKIKTFKTNITGEEVLSNPGLLLEVVALRKERDDYRAALETITEKPHPTDTILMRWNRAHDLLREVLAKYPKAKA